MLSEEFVEKNPMPHAGYRCLTVPRNIEMLFQPLPSIEEAEDPHAVVADYRDQGAFVVDFSDQDAGVAVAEEEINVVPETPDQLVDQHLETGNNIAT
jgi:hypothetical protein